MKTSKRKLFCSAEQENCERRFLDSNSAGQHSNNVGVAAGRPTVKEPTKSTILKKEGRSTEAVQNLQTPKHHVGLTERQQMAILLQLTANAQSSFSNGLSPKTPRHSDRPLKAAKGQRRSGLKRRGRLLLQKRNERGETLLHLAAIRGDAKQVQRLIRLGADVNCPDFAGWTPLHEACNHGWFRVGQLLLKAGADVDARGFDDFTPLHDAAVNSHPDLVELLLQHGALPTPKNVNGKTPLSLASLPTIVDILKQFDHAASRTVYPADHDVVISASRDGAEQLEAFDNQCGDDEQQLTSPSCSTSSACSISSNNMRKSSPQHQTPKGPDKPSSPRLTLRFQPIKSRDERHGSGGAAAAAAPTAAASAAAAAGGVVGDRSNSSASSSSKTTEVTSSEPRYQSYCVTMETADEEDDVYEFKKDPSEESPLPPPSLLAHLRTSASSTSSAFSVGAAGVSATAPATSAANSSVPGDDLCDQQFNVVSSTKDATLRIQQTNVDSAVNNNNRGTTKMNENHVIRAAGDVDCGKVAGKNSAENTNHDVSSEGVAGACEHEDGKRKRKRDAKDEISSKIASSGGGNGGVGGGMSLRNHGRGDKGSSSRAENAAESAENNARGSETESTQSDAENEAPDSVMQQELHQQQQQQQQPSGLPKVPPLKIVIPPTSMAEQSSDRDRNRVASRHSLPYIVNSSEDAKGQAGNGDDSQQQQQQPTSALPSAENSKENLSSSTCTAFSAPHPNPSTASAAHPAKEESVTTSAKSSRDGAGVHSTEERSHRVTRSSQRMAAMATGTAGATVSLNASLQSLQDYVSGGDCAKANKFDDQGGAGSAEEHNGTEMPPRKRKLRPRGSDGGPGLDASGGGGGGAASSSSSSSSSVSSHYEEQSMYLNCYEMFLNLRREIDRRHTSMFVVQPKAPQGFKDYLMNKCSYVLAGNAASRLSVPMIPPPQSLTGLMKELYVAQEKARYSLRLQHIIEREKLTLSFEQETLRVHGRAARAMANQAVPLSVCTILKDEEVYNQIEPEQEEKERNARTRFNGRLFLSWLQDVDDKWDKVKKAMLLRHHNEAESLHAAQKLDWEWKLKELGICDTKSTPAIDVIHVPIVHVSDEFDLLTT